MLGAVLTVLAWGLLAAFVLLILAAALPLRVELALNKREAWAYRAVLRPLAGFGPRIVLRDSADRAKSKRSKSDRKRGKAPTFGRQDPLRSLRVLTRLATDLLHHVRVDKALLDMTFGLGDPAETGQAFGIVAPLIYSGVALPRTCLRVEPDFAHTILRGRGDFAVSLIPITLVPLLVRFGWSAFGPRR